MVEAGILDGDYALIRRTDVARDGQIVVALIDDSEATLKYFRREGSMVRLDPANRPMIRNAMRQRRCGCRASCRAFSAATTDPGARLQSLSHREREGAQSAERVRVRR